MLRLARDPSADPDLSMTHAAMDLNDVSAFKCRRRPAYEGSCADDRTWSANWRARSRQVRELFVWIPSARGGNSGRRRTQSRPIHSQPPASGAFTREVVDPEVDTARARPGLDRWVTIAH